MKPATLLLAGIPRRPDIEVVAWPGKGSFRGDADCKVFVMLEPTNRPPKAATQADVILTDLAVRLHPDVLQFRLNEFPSFLETIMTDTRKGDKRQVA